MEMIDDLKITVPWGVISGKLWGNRCDKPVLMVHGFLDNSDTFDNLIPLLPQSGFYYLCIDLPGHGKSSHFPSGVSYNIFNYIETIRSRVIEYLKLEKLYYVGHSLGGHIGYYLAALFPENIIKLIILDTVPFIIPNNWIRDNTRINMVNKLKFEQQIENKERPEFKFDEVVKRIINGRMGFISEDGARLLAKRNIIQTDDGYKFITDPMLRLGVPNYYSLEQQITFMKNIECPTIIILTTESMKAYRKDFRNLYPKLFGSLKNIKRFVIEGGHSVHIDNPEPVASLITNFLQNDSNCKL